MQFHEYFKPIRQFSFSQNPKSRAFEGNWPFRRWSLTNCPQSKSSDCQSLSGLKSYRRQILFYFRKRSNLPNWDVLTRKKTITSAKKGHKNLLYKILLQYFHLSFSEWSFVFVWWRQNSITQEQSWSADPFQST